MLKTRRATVIVNTKTGKAFRGVLWSRGRFYVLRNVEILDGREPRPLDGDVVIERANVDFYQAVG